MKEPDLTISAPPEQELRARFERPGDPASRRVARIAGIFIVTLAVGMAVGGFYENIEWLEDKYDILGGHFVKGLWDTETDLLCDATGSLAGATFITIWALRGWS